MGVMDDRRRILLAQDGFVPPEYAIYDYLVCTGYKAVIDTGVPGNDETLVIDFSYMPVTVGNYGGQIGNYVDEDTACWRIIKSTSTYNQYMIFSLGNRKAGSSPSGKAVSGETVNGVRVDYHLTYGAFSLKSYDGQISSGSAVTDSSPRSTGNIALGCNRVITNGTGTSQSRIYSCRIKSHGKLIRSYVPVVRKSDSKPGFYDTVNCTFNPSIGTAEFIAGNDT